MPRPLTQRQQEVLSIIARAVDSTGREPSLVAIGRELGGIAPPSVFKHIIALEKKGFLRRRVHQRPPFALVAPPPDQLTLNPTLDLPVIGTLGAGEPIRPLDRQAEGETQHVAPVERITVESGLAARSLATVILRVEGYGLAAEGLLDGDLLLVHPGRAAHPGDTVVALLDSGVATVRRYFPKAGLVRLLPAQPAGEPIVRADVHIYGTVLAVVRRLGRHQAEPDGN